MESITKNLPVLALRGLTVFPEMSTGFDVERERSLNALHRAADGNQEIFLVTQREIGTQQPGATDLYEFGTICLIEQLVPVSETAVRVVVLGKTRGRLRRLWQAEPYLQAQVEELPEQPAPPRSDRLEAMLRQTYAIFSEYAEMAPRITDELMSRVMDTQDPGYLADLIAQHITLRHQDKQRVLEELRPMIRLQQMNEILAREVNVIAMEMDIEHKMRKRIGQVQKEFILREQIKVLQGELGHQDEGNDELRDYDNAIRALALPEEAERKLLKDLDRLSKHPFGSAEASVLRNYLDACLELPWNNYTKQRLSISLTRKTLDKDHFGLEKVKERILESIAVRRRNPEGKAQILCLVGPPGVGKTSVAASVAKATGRKLARLSLGGVRDEAEIRGHRKTYVGAMPGRIVAAITQCGSMNPLMLLDEIDKLGNDYRGDPASALLEVLDGEQNYAFRDHYIELPLDLSQVMFLTTANTTATIPRPLLDRMEIIELSSYTDEEKLEIAKRHLLPKQRREHGLSKAELRVSDEAMRAIITDYTRESGVRKLERQLAKLCRCAVMQLEEGKSKRLSVTTENLTELLGAGRIPSVNVAEKNQVGVVNGLAWTETGGELLQVEVNVMEGTGKLELTGNLGEVMQESVKAALSCLRSRAAELDISSDFYRTRDIHVHFPEGAVPKDGPSAGIAIATALLSALTGRPVRGEVAMTGEVTLRGRVLPIGGLREKTMAALRCGVKTVLLPKENEKDLEEIDQTVRAKLRFVPVETVETVFAEAVLPQGKSVQEFVRGFDAGVMQ